MESSFEIIPLITTVIGIIMGYKIDSTQIIYYIAYGAIIGTTIQFLCHAIFRKKMKKMTLYTGLIIYVLFGLTIILHNENFAYAKLTVLPWLMAIIFLLLPRFKNKTVFEYMLGEQISAPKEIWLKTNIWWVIFNFLTGLVNIVIWIAIVKNMMTRNDWVTYKLILIPLTFVFTIALVFYIYKHQHKSDEMQLDVANEQSDDSQKDS